MQLNKEVLPAPFGPMTAAIEPSCTAKLTLDSASRPPKLSVRLTTSRIGSLPLSCSTVLPRPLAAPCLRHLELRLASIRRPQCIAREHTLDRLVEIAARTFETFLPVGYVTAHPQGRRLAVARLHRIDDVTMRLDEPAG